LPEASLPPGGFSGGEAAGQAKYLLRRLGFTIIGKGEDGIIVTAEYASVISQAI
jgi:hypothetical protein